MKKEFLDYLYCNRVDQSRALEAAMDTRNRIGTPPCKECGYDHFSEIDKEIKRCELALCETDLIINLYLKLHK